MKIRLLTAVLALLMFSCGGEEPGVPADAYYTAEVVNGVRHVHNYRPQWGSEPERVRSAQL